MEQINQDTIIAQATAPGKSGVGIVRISGNKALAIATEILGFTPTPRHAHYSSFTGENAEIIDQGIALFFPNPHSFTGEDVIELQGHGGPIILDFILKRALTLGARLARPGEFSERAFLNNKLDLTQAEAIADLIDSSSEQAALCAMRSLQGVFSKQINELVEALISLRIYVEAAIDFPEEEIDFLNDGKIKNELEALLETLTNIRAEAKQGSLLREGMNVVIAGLPNAGKSSLLNALAGQDRAIVTNIAGTTRDVLREQIHIDGMPLHIIDTAGLRLAPDEVERIGIERAWQEINQADQLLLMFDGSSTSEQTPELIWPEFKDKLPNKEKIILIKNKADLTGAEIAVEKIDGYKLISLSAKTNQGLDLLKQQLKQSMGFKGATEGSFIARRRHLEALEQAHQLLETGYDQLLNHAAGELLAEDLKQAQNQLNEITGEFSSDDLLGRIFSSFCIGK